MTQAEAKASIDKAFCESLGRLFGVLTANIRTQPAGKPQAEFQDGFEYALRAHEIATRVAETLIKD